MAWQGRAIQDNTGEYAHNNIFRKHSSLIYFIDPASKFFITQLNHMCQMFIGCNLMQTFKYKYHDHKYDDCRLIKINSNVKYICAYPTVFSISDKYNIVMHTNFGAQTHE